MQNHPRYRNVQLTDAEVHMEGYVKPFGRKILFVEDVDEWIEENLIGIKYSSLVVLEVAGNDLQENYYCDPWALADKIYAIAKRLRRVGASRVIIMQCLYRHGIGAIPKWKHDLSKRSRKRCMNIFMGSVRTYNSRIAYKCKNHEDGTIVFRKQYGLRRNWKYILKDGIHVRSSYMPKYFSNLRSCLIAQGLKCRRYRHF